MYLEHFGLNVKPFGLSPKLDFLYKSGAFEESMAHLIYGLDNSEAIVLITGAIGTGKTMALQSFLSHLGSNFTFALVTNTSVTSTELLKLILDDLGVEFPLGVDKSDLLILFKNFLLKSSRDGKKVLVVVDEAQNLSRDVLEEVRLLTNLGQGEGQPVQIVLLGQPELEELLNRADLAQLRQRIRVHYRLDPLTRQELQGYLSHRMQVAGAESEAFSKAAVDRIYELSGGVPRVVNTLAGDALLSAFVAGRHEVRPEDVEERTEFKPEPVAVKAPARVVLERESGLVDMPERATSEPGRIDTVVAPRASAPPVMATRSRTGDKRSGRGWWVASLVVVVGLAGSYALGYLDPLLGKSGDSRQAGATEQVTGQVPAARSQPTQAVQPQTDPESEDPTESLPAGDESSNRSVDSAQTEVAVAVQEPALVRPETVPVTKPAASAPALSGFFIHVSSFRTEERAGVMVASLVAKGHAASWRVQTVEGQSWYRVYIGPYGDRDAAVRMANVLQDEGRLSYYKIVALGSSVGS